MRNIVLFGVESSYAADMLESMRRCGHVLRAGIITGALEWDLHGVDPSFHDEIPRDLLGADCLVPWMTPGWSKQRVERAQAGGLRLGDTLVDVTGVTPSSFVSGPGTYLNAGAVIGAQCQFGQCVMIGRNASVGHHSNLADYVTVGPGAALASKTRVETGTLIGAGATVAPEVTIGSNSVVASGAAVFRDVPDNVLVVGNPARITRRSIVGHNGVGVC